MNRTLRTIDDKPIRWRDSAGTMHAIEGCDFFPGVRLLWTACHALDVPAGEAWLGPDEVTGAACQETTGDE